MILGKMSGIEGIIGEIERKANERIASVHLEADEKAKAILASAQRKAKEYREDSIKSAHLEAEREASRILVKARTEARQELLHLKENLLREVFGRTQEMLRKIEEHQEVDGVRYETVMKRLLKNSLVALGETSAGIHCRKQDREIFSPEFCREVEHEVKWENNLACSIELAYEPIHATGGLIVRSNDGKVQVDNTFEAIVDRLHEAFCVEVSHTLFEDQGSRGMGQG